MGGDRRISFRIDRQWQCLWVWLVQSREQQLRTGDLSAVVVACGGEMKNEQVDNGIHSTRAMDMGIVPAELPGFVCSINKYRYWSGVRRRTLDIHTYSYFLTRIQLLLFPIGPTVCTPRYILSWLIGDKHSTLLYSTLLYSTLLYPTLLYSTLLCM